MNATRAIRNLVRDSSLALREAQERLPLVGVWDDLQERDAAGTARGPLPYTDAAIRRLTEIHNRNPDDIAVVHHLAIAHHARAWDQELQGRSQPAAREWETALGYWRQIASTAEFWTAQKAKLHACQADADAAELDELRRNLLEHLLTIHVDFVRHYIEGNQPQRAAAHIELVRRSRVPPREKKRLVERIFQAMTSTVPNACAAGEFRAALQRVDSFLALFPDHLSALRLEVEICDQWLGKLSSQQQWDEIVVLDKCAWPPAECLARHMELTTDSLAVMALVSIATKFVDRADDQQINFQSSIGEQQPSPAYCDSLMEQMALGIRWGRLACRHCATGSQLPNLLAHCLACRTLIRLVQGKEVMEGNSDIRVRIRAIDNLLQQGESDLEEAIRVAPLDNMVCSVKELQNGSKDEINKAKQMLSIY